MKNSLLVIALLIGAVFFLSNFTVKMDHAKSYHSSEELQMFQNALQNPIGPGDYFLTSQSCRGCHGFDSLGQANIDENGVDINLFDHWEGSMMALSAKDPFWRAKVSHEILTNPAHSNALQTKCTSCHAPMGHYDAIYNGATEYTIADLINDSLGLDGVSCAGCHTISPNVGNSFSGVIPFDTTRQIYGPYPGPFAGPMQLYEGYTPVYSPHMDESSVCSPCHTLITETVDLAGNYTGGEFIEQATYHEYLNSSYPVNGIKCQTCHMPQLPDPVIIANGYTALQPRFPFNQHTFAGANYFMLGLIRNNKAALNVQAADARFDSSMAATLKMLQEQSVEFELANISLSPDTAYFRVKIKNKAGHKFPSGYPARRAVLQLVMTDNANDTIFRSGIFDSEFRVTAESSQFEPHRNIINQDGQTLIYEMVMGDVNSNYTTLLERAAIMLKDNRIPPTGFTTSASVYDTVAITADALADPDFNIENAVEGSGTDYVHFKIPVSGITGQVKVAARLYYQSVPPKFLDEMFAINSGPIDTFKTMYQGADKQPVLVASDSITTTLTGLGENGQVTVNASLWPSLSGDGKVNIKVEKYDRIEFIEVYTSDGKRVQSFRNVNTHLHTFYLPAAKGQYLIRIKTRLGDAYKRVLRL
jgi:hypothetical protein